MRPFIAPATSRPVAGEAGPSASLTAYGISVGVSCEVVDGKGVSTTRGAIRELSPERAADWFADGWPVVIARDGDEAQRVADAYAIAWDAAPSAMDQTSDLKSPRAPAKSPRRRAVTARPAVKPKSRKDRPMAATKKAAKPKSLKKPAEPATDVESSATVAPPAEPQAELALARDDLAAGEAKLAKSFGFNKDHDTLVLKVEAARAHVAALEVRAMPMPTAMGLSFFDGEVPVDAILTTGNHRERIDDASLQQLARSIQIHGLQQRVGVRACAAGKYELIFGARRFAATKLAGLSAVSAKIYAQDLTPAQVEILRTMENFGRQELTHVERAIAVARTIDAIEQTLAQAMTGSDDPLPMGQGQDLEAAIFEAGSLHAYVGQQLGYPPRWVQDHAYVAKLGGGARELLAAGRLPISHARELAKLGDKKAADDVASIVAKRRDGTGGETIEQCRKLVTDRLRSLRGVPWELAVAFGQGEKGCTGYACSTCPFNSKSDPDLFGGAVADEPATGTCTHSTCFEAKQAITARDIAKVVAKAKPKVVSGKIEATESGIREFVPLHVRSSSAARKVKKETEVPSAPRSAPGEKKEAADPIVAAKLDYERQRDDWAEGVAKKLIKAIDSPARRLAFHACREAVRDLRHHAYTRYSLGGDTDARAEQSREDRMESVEAVLKGRSVKAFAAAVATPTIEKILTAADDDDIEEWQLSEMHDDLLSQIAKSLDVALDAPPDRGAIIAAATSADAATPPPEKQQSPRRRKAAGEPCALSTPTSSPPASG